MIISVASLTLRFYEVEGWTESKVRTLLVSPEMEITYREGNKNLRISGYFAVYVNSGLKIFKKSEMDKHTFEDRGNFGDVDWYIKKDDKSCNLCGLDKKLNEHGYCKKCQKINEVINQSRRERRNNV